MDGPADRSNKYKPMRDSDSGEEGNSAGPPNVKVEELPDVGKGGPTETRRKAAVAAPHEEPVVDKAACPGTRTAPLDSSSEDDPSSGRSDHSVTPPFLGKRSPVTGSRPRHLSNDDGKQAGRGNVTDLKRRARSRSGGHGIDGRRSKARRIGCRSGASAQLRSGRSAERRAPGSTDSIPSPNRFCRNDKAQLFASKRRSRSGGDAGGFRGRTRPPPRRHTRNASSRSRSGGDDESHTMAGSMNCASRTLS